MDWITLFIGAVIGALISIPFGIFVNFSTDWIKSYFKKRKLSIRERRIYTLREDFRYISELKENLTRLIVLALNRMVIHFLGVTVLIYAVGVITLGGFLHNKGFTQAEYTSIGLFTSFNALYIFSSVWRTLRITRKLVNFDTYRERTIKDLKKLGTTLEEDNYSAKKRK